MNLSPRHARWVAGAALALPILALSLKFAAGGRSLSGVDYQTYYRPHAVFAGEAFRRDGELPRWNPFQYAGAPLLGNGQSNLYYPGNWPFLVMDPDLAFEALIVSHLLLAAIGLYRLTRHFRLERPACVLASIAYSISFSVLMRIHAGHLPYFVTICQAPLLLALVVKTADRPTLLHGLALAGMTGLVLLGGNPQFIYQLGLVCAALAAWRVAARPPGGPTPSRILLTLSAAVGTGLALASVQLLPTLEVASASSRRAVDPVLLASLSEPFHDFSPIDLLAFWIPRYGWTPSAEAWLPHEKALYLGILPLLLALHQVSTERFRGATRFWTLVAVVALLEAFGRSFVVHPVLSFLPGFSLFRIPERVVWVTVLSLSILSAFGWSSAARSAPPLRSLAGSAALAAGAAGIIFISFRAPEALVLLGIAAVSIGILRYAPRGPAAAAAAICFAALDLVGYGLARVQSVPREQVQKPPWYARTIGPERNDGRLLDLTAFDAGGVAHGFRLFRGVGYPVPAETASFYASGWSHAQTRMESLPEVSGSADPAMLRRLQIRWIVADAAIRIPGWNVRDRDGSVVLLEDPVPGRAAELESGTGEVAVTRPGANSLEVTARLSSPGRVTVSEAWSAGWRARRNGSAVPVLPAAGGLLGFDAPQGESRTTFVYAPSGWIAGRILSGIALAALGVGAAVGFARRRKRQELPSDVR